MLGIFFLFAITKIVKAKATIKDIVLLFAASDSFAGASSGAGSNTFSFLSDNRVSDDSASTFHFAKYALNVFSLFSFSSAFSNAGPKFLGTL